MKKLFLAILGMTLSYGLLAQTIQIDRSKPFDPSSLGPYWNIVEQDEHSLAISELALDSVLFVDMLEQGEEFVIGEERLERLKKSKYVPLDAKVFHILSNNTDLIPSHWKDKIDGKYIRNIFFDGTILLNPEGHRCVLYLYWLDGRWYWERCLLLIDTLSWDSSAVISAR